MTIPWIIAGPRVVRRGPAHASRCGPSTRRVTVLSLLSVPVPVSATGKLVSEAFEAQ